MCSCAMAFGHAERSEASHHNTVLTMRCFAALNMTLKIIVMLNEMKHLIDFLQLHKCGKVQLVSSTFSSVLFQPLHRCSPYRLALGIARQHMAAALEPT